jgi:hypothetical protein
VAAPGPIPPDWAAPRKCAAWERPVGCYRCFRHKHGTPEEFDVMVSLFDGLGRAHDALGP